MIYDLCDAALIMPGGNGTLDELFEMLTWNTLKIHDKKIILLNCNGFYDHLMAHMQMMQSQGFLYENFDHRLMVASTAEEAVHLLQSF